MISLPVLIPALYLGVAIIAVLVSFQLGLWVRRKDNGRDHCCIDWQGEWPDHPPRNGAEADRDNWLSLP